jgi:glutamyl-tRNA synthetase
MASSVRVRIAPSPTGDPHVGTAYIALFNYVFARQQHGRFILRIEDTDQARSRADSEQAIFDALRWLGLTWEEGPDVGGPHAPYRQSERSAIYLAHAQELVQRGKAYPCFCTEARLEEVRQRREAEKSGESGYDRHCRAIAPADAARRIAAGESHTIRLAVPLTGEVTYRDMLRGDVTFDVAQVDDQVLLKSDGMPTYHLANVVDDHLMQISHVIRGQEWISSTPKHVLLYQAFGWTPPAFFHMPLLLSPAGGKISKRDNASSVNFYRDAGILPQALLNHLAKQGWSFGGDREKFTVDEMVSVFSWERMSTSNPTFDMDKLVWLNEQYLHELSEDQLVDAMFGWRFGRDYLKRVLPLVQKRVKKLDEVVPAIDFFFTGDLDYAPVLAEMTIPDTAPDAIARGILQYVERFEAHVGWQAKHLEAEARAWCEAIGWKTKHAFMLLRLAATGRKASPPLFETMAVLGKEVTRRRLRRAAEIIGATKPT